MSFVPSSFLFLVVRTGAPSSVLAPSNDRCQALLEDCADVPYRYSGLECGPRGPGMGRLGGHPGFLKE